MESEGVLILLVKRRMTKAGGRKEPNECLYKEIVLMIKGSALFVFDKHLYEDQRKK